MEKKILFEKIETLLSVLKQYQKDQTMDFGTLEKKQYLVDVLREIYNRPSLQPDLACPTCVREYLNQLVPYYEREYPKYLKTIEVNEEVPAKVIEEDKPSTGKPKRKSKKNGNS